MPDAVLTDGETPAAARTAHPPCPACGDGFLVPLGMMAFYVCTQPGCTYTISAQGHTATYFKGHAVAETKEKGGKRWAEFKF